MAITRTAFGSIIFTSGVEDPVSSSLSLGTNAGRAVVSFMSIGNTYNISGVSVTSGDSLGTSDVVDVDGFKRYGHAGVVTQTGGQTVTFDTTSPVGQGKWGTLASYDDVASIRSVTVFSGASGTNPSATVSTANGDKVVMLGISNGTGATLSAAGGATDFDGGAADAVALEKDATGASTTINGTWSSNAAWYVAVFVLVPISAPTGYTLTSDQGSYTITGQAATLTYSASGTAYTLTAESATYLITGGEAYRAIELSVDSGTYSLTGQAATLAYSPVSGTFVLTADGGSYSYSGQLADLIKTTVNAYVIPADSGNYTYFGRIAHLLGPGDLPTLGPGDKFVKLALLGYTGSINDMLLKYYKDNGATSNVLNHAEMQFLAIQGATALTLNNRRRQFYTSLGYTGSLPDMEYQYWWEL